MFAHVHPRDVASSSQRELAPSPSKAYPQASEVLAAIGTVLVAMLAIALLVDLTLTALGIE
jgi:hypothetical protein